MSLKYFRASKVLSGFLLLAVLPGRAALGNAPEIAVTNNQFTIVFGAQAADLTSLKRTKDVFDTEYLSKGKTLGDVFIQYRDLATKPWQSIRTASLAGIAKVELQAPGHFEIAASIGRPESPDLAYRKEFILDGDHLLWKFRLENQKAEPIEIGDIALPEEFNTDFVAGGVMDRDAVERTYHTRLNRHSFISGDGSFVFWMRANGIGPFLVMTPLAGTRLEYWDQNYIGYIHSGGNGASETRGTWRRPHTTITLAPKGERGSSVEYGFRFTWAKDYDGVRDVLYQNGGFDIQVVPGMTIPRDLSVMFSLRTRNQIAAVEPEYPKQTQLDYVGEKEKGLHVYRARFDRLGENLIRVRYEGNREMILEFFVTEPLETVIKKRAAFIARKQQHRAPGQWWDGLFSIWDARAKTLRGPGNLGGLDRYMVEGADDPSSGKSLFLSEKNVLHPDPAEIEALEYFLQNFVWGKLQRTGTESPFPYGIYGSENWFENRNSGTGYGNGGHGQERMWRTFDYTHYVALYYNMYRIAKQYPQHTRYLDARGYLERAFGTAKAFYTVPYNIKMGESWSFRGWCDWAYKLGNFHEKYLVDLIRALRQEGRSEDAKWLEREWEKKVKFFLYDDPYPFGSEFVFDRTAFESTHAIAKYAWENPLQPDEKLWYDKNLNKWYSHPKVKREDALVFMDRQIQANLAMRGWLETAYYTLGSAVIRAPATLDYMSQMAGWSILDYALYYSQEPATYARLGYASLLSSWCLVNSGTPESNYGYWFPGPENDGAAGWVFKPEKHGDFWRKFEYPRGSCFVCGEIDHGFTGGLNAACTVAVDDPIFGRFAYGGELTREGDTTRVIPRDGARRQFHFVGKSARVHLILETDGFKSESPIAFTEQLDRIDFVLENRSKRPHLARLNLGGLNGRYQFIVDSQVAATTELNGQVTKLVEVQVEGKAESQLRIQRVAE